jgi:hypothetical protein
VYCRSQDHFRLVRNIFKQANNQATKGKKTGGRKKARKKERKKERKAQQASILLCKEAELCKQAKQETI